MKKTVTLPDGTVEVLEGTPEEIAAHEKLIRERVVKEQRKKPDVLKGAPEDFDLARKLEEILKKLDEPRPSYPVYPVQPWWPTERPIWIAACSQCHSYPCVCQHYDLYPKIYCQTTTSDKVELRPNAWADMGLTCSFPQRDMAVSCLPTSLGGEVWVGETRAPDWAYGALPKG